MQENLEKIIETKKGKIDKDFWRKIIMETEEDIVETIGCLIDIQKKKID